MVVARDPARLAEVEDRAPDAIRRDRMRRCEAMLALGPEHAFGPGGIYPKPVRRRLAARAAAGTGDLFDRTVRAHRVLRAWRTSETGSVIGAGCLIGPNAWRVNDGPRERISIGAGAIVAAGSVVTRAVPAGKIAAGNPARVVGDAPP